MTRVQREFASIGSQVSVKILDELDDLAVFRPLAESGDAWSLRDLALAKVVALAREFTGWALIITATRVVEGIVGVAIDRRPGASSLVIVVHEDDDPEPGVQRFLFVDLERDIVQRVLTAQEALAAGIAITQDALAARAAYQKAVQGQ